jgi:hypothetical protein
MDSLSPTLLSSNTHYLTVELVQKIAQADLAEIACLSDALYEWWDSGSNPSPELLLQYTQLTFLLCIREDQLHTH